MGLTGRLARTCAVHPRRTLALWGLAVVGALALVATSLHGLSTQGYVIGSPQSIRAKQEIAKAFPAVALGAKQDVIIVSSSAYTVLSREFGLFAKRRGTTLEATGDVSHVRLAGA